LLVGVGFVITKSRERTPKAPKPTEAPAPVAAPTSGPSLYIMTGPETGQKKYLRHGFTIGKAPDCDLSLAHDGFASGHHAHVQMDTAGNCNLVDQGSTNGTYINGVRITESRLFDGMSIRCGSTELRFLAQ
jgi:pSer/pThr/pTyr-binding forkhead associated (FHA) protein